MPLECTRDLERKERIAAGHLVDTPQHGPWRLRSDACVKDVLERTERQRVRIHAHETILTESPPQRHGKLVTLLRDPLCQEQPDWLVANATAAKPRTSAEA